MLKNLYGEKRVTRTQAELNAVLAQHERFATSRSGTRALLSMSDLTGLNLANRTLSEADFTGASLMGASLFGSNLVHASFYCTDLQMCDLRCANLRYADMRGASFRGANLSFACMDYADLRVAMMMLVSRGSVSFVDHSVASGEQACGVDFTNCSMKKVSFGNAKLDGANFSGALLQGANFRGAKLSNANFDGAVLAGVNLSELAVPREALRGCITDVTPEAKSKFEMLRARLEAHHEWVASDGRRGSHGVLDGEDLRPLQELVALRPLSAISARNVVAVGLNFARCELPAVRFDGADLRDADFSGADLRGASFRGARLSHARFDKADLRSLRLENGHVRCADFTGAQATRDQFDNAILDVGIADLGLSAPTAAPPAMQAAG
jgi:uncharacterized protein YjbI with pentapeptide repeats